MTSANANPIGIGGAGVVGDARDGAAATGATVNVVPATPVALFAVPCGGRVAMANYAAATGRALPCALYATVAYDEPTKANARAAADGIRTSPSCSFSATVSTTIGSLAGCEFRPSASTAARGGAAAVTVSYGGLSSAMSLSVAVPTTLELRADDVELTAIGELCGGATTYQSTRLRLLADGLDISHLDGVEFVPSSSSVVAIDTVDASTARHVARGEAAGSADVRLRANAGVTATITVSDTIVPLETLSAVAITGASVGGGLGSALALPFTTATPAAVPIFKQEGDIGWVYATLVRERRRAHRGGGRPQPDRDRPGRGQLAAGDRDAADAALGDRGREGCDELVQRRHPARHHYRLRQTVRAVLGPSLPRSPRARRRHPPLR